MTGSLPQTPLRRLPYDDHHDRVDESKVDAIPDEGGLRRQLAVFEHDHSPGKHHAKPALHQSAHHPRSNCHVDEEDEKGVEQAITVADDQEPFEEAAGFGNATWPSSLTNEDAVLPTRRSELQPKQQHCEQVAEEGEGEHGVEKRGK